MGAVNSKTQFIKDYLILICKLLLLAISAELFLRRAWVGEDAFIFFRYVDNFINGNGLVFNIGERVEGFTSLLWVLVLAAVKILTGEGLRQIAIVLGVILSTATIGLMLFVDRQKSFLPLVPILLLTNWAFRDFATSGFETSLTYLLVGAVCISIKRNYHQERPMLLGLSTSMLALNRPEAFLVIIFYIAFYLASYIKGGNKYYFVKLFKFILPVILLVGTYQIFRMGYFASLLPNTFYAKKGGDFYMNQGVNYIVDFIKSYKIFVFAYLVLFMTYIADRFYKFSDDTLRQQRLHIFVLFGLLVGYVLYAGGDYMHGRSLLMAVVFISFALSDLPAEYWISIKKVVGNEYTGIIRTVGLALLVGVYFLNIRAKPYPIVMGKQTNNINDERSHFGYEFNRKDFDTYFKEEITGQFGWRDRALYYKEVSQAVNMPLSVVMWNIGFFGYAGGDSINVMGSVLTDPVLARFPIENRGKIGHENSAHWEYLLSRKPTFSYTPFKYWNESAHAKYLEAPHVFIIKDDSNDSYIPVFDLSNVEFIDKFSKLTKTPIKNNIDTAQIALLKKIKYKEELPEINDLNLYLDFLKVYWYPYADDSAQDLFDEVTKEVPPNIYSQFDVTESVLMWDRITKPLNNKLFLQNIAFSLGI